MGRWADRVGARPPDGVTPEAARVTGAAPDPTLPWADYARALTDPARARERPEALDDLLVLDCSQASFAGLFASSILAEFGATVVRVEPPGGDPARRFSPEGRSAATPGWPTSWRAATSTTSR